VLSRDGSLRFWEMPRHAVLGPALRAFRRGDMAQLTYTGADELVSWDGAGAALRRRVDVDAWMDKACDLAGRRLTKAEWAQYLPGEPYRPACRGP